MRFLENRIFGKKTGSGHPGDIIDMMDHEKRSILVYVHDRFLKIRKNGDFVAKPETGQNLSGKKFSSGIFFFVAHFKNTFIFSIDKGILKI